MNTPDTLVQTLDHAVKLANKDRRWVNEVFSVSSIIEDAEREVRIQTRLAHKEGLEEGAKLAEAQYNTLIEHLFADNRQNDILRAATDTAYREQLFREYNISQ